MPSRKETLNTSNHQILTVHSLESSNLFVDLDMNVDLFLLESLEELGTHEIAINDNNYDKSIKSIKSTYTHTHTHTISNTNSNNSHQNLQFNDTVKMYADNSMMQDKDDFKRNSQRFEETEELINLKFQIDGMKEQEVLGETIFFKIFNAVRVKQGLDPVDESE